MAASATRCHRGVVKPMRALAQAWGTDASAATWVVDRLERKGLAERRALPGDRRVKLVVLTPLGVQTRDEVLGKLAASVIVRGGMNRG